MEPIVAIQTPALPSVWLPTHQLRWLRERSRDGVLSDEPTLQQRWVDHFSSAFEWRDVPTVDEVK